VVHGGDGSDEITPAAETRAVEVRGGELRSLTIRPEDYGISRCRPADLVGADAATNAATIRAILAGDAGPKADAVALNAGAGLHVGSAAEDLARGVAAARDILAEGKALGVL
jgi:anthranilate phosphoribosyltransferase